MKLEEIIKEVLKLNKLNKKLHINKKYNVYLENRYKSFTLDNTSLEELERFWNDNVYTKLKTYNFIYSDTWGYWDLEINTSDETLYFELHIQEVH